MMRRSARWKSVATVAVLVGGLTFAGMPAVAQEQGAAPADAGREGPSNSELRAQLDEALAQRSIETPVANLEVWFQGDEAVARAEVAAVGGVVNGYVEGTLLQAELPLDRVAELEATESITQVSPLTDASGVPEIPAGEAGADTRGVTGHHVVRTNADDWQARGFTGQGVKIGLIDAFDKPAWDSAVAAGDLRTPAGTFCTIGGSPCDVYYTNSDHGVGVAEVIHDLAPHAQLYIAAVYTPADTQAAVDWMASQGVTIISRSLTSEYDGDGRGHGAMDSVIDSAVSKGILWVNSAGNSAGDGGFTPGTYWRKAWTDGDGDGWMDFAPGDEFLGIECTFWNGFRWSDWGGTKTDYDVYVYDTPGGPVIGSSENDQTAGAQPLEFPGCGSTVDGVVFASISKYSEGNGSAGDILEFMSNGGGVEYPSNPYSATGPAAESANSGALSVGAIDPSAGGETAIAVYSSRGPSNDGRIEPDVSAPSCIAGHTFSCFNGTSAAAPVVSGLAAVVASSGAAVGPVNLGNYMRTNVVDRGAGGPDTTYGTGEVRLPAPPAVPAATGAFHSLTPARIFDSRSGTALGPGASVTVQVTGVAGVPSSGVTAAVLNVTGVVASAPTFLTVYPNGEAKPASSNVNLAAGETAPNLVISKLGSDGKVKITNSSGNVHVLVDISGWFGPASGDGYAGLTPARIADTRTSLGLPGGPLGANETRDLKVVGVGGVPGSGVSAVVVNVTAVSPTLATDVRLWPAGSPKPSVSNLNVPAGAVRPNLAVVKVGAGGKISVRNQSGATEVLVDVVGYFGPGVGAGRLRPLSPVRILDTRNGIGHIPFALPASTPISFSVRPGAGVPTSGASAVILNVTVTGATAGSHLTVWPGGAALPTASNLNYVAGQTVPNLVVVKIGPDGTIQFRNKSGTVHVIADVVGYLS